MFSTRPDNSACESLAAHDKFRVCFFGLLGRTCRVQQAIVSHLSCAHAAFSWFSCQVHWSEPSDVILKSQ